MRSFLGAIGITLLWFLLFQANRALAVEDAQALVEANARGEVIRLHILANSDSDNDQQIKLQVRDAVLSAFTDEFSALSEPDEIYQALQGRAQDMADAANEVLARAGAEYQAAARVGVLHLPEKRYGDVILPEGEYRGLQLVLGQGAGQNWFCVLFPRLCLITPDDPPKLWALDILRLWIGQW